MSRGNERHLFRDPFFMREMVNCPNAIHYIILSEPFLEPVVALERRTNKYPWTRGNFVDSMRQGHEVRCMLIDDQIQGYTVTMSGVYEAHLLNITVAPAFQGFGYGRILLGYAALYALGRGETQMHLEVRESNKRAIRLYETYGFRQIGLRKAYYPADNGERENAVTMLKALI